MAMVTINIKCCECNKEKNIYECRGCLKNFCFEHLSSYRQIVSKQFDQIEDNRNSLLQTLIEQKENVGKYPLIQQINKWEEQSIKKIKQIADRCRRLSIRHLNRNINAAGKKFDNLTKQIKQIRNENEFDETDCNKLLKSLRELQEDLEKSANISLEQESTSFIDEIFIIPPFGMSTVLRSLVVNIRISFI